MFPRLSCVCMLLEMWVEVKVHSYHKRAHVLLVIVCVARKLHPCPSYSRRRDRNNSVHWRGLYKGGGVQTRVSHAASCQCVPVSPGGPTLFTTLPPPPPCNPPPLAIPPPPWGGNRHLAAKA